MAFRVGNEALQPPVALHAVAADQTVALHLLEHAVTVERADAKHTLHVALIHRPFLALDQYVVQRVALDARQSSVCTSALTRLRSLWNSRLIQPPKSFSTPFPPFRPYGGYCSEANNILARVCGVVMQFSADFL